MCSNLYFFEKNIFSNVTILNKNKKIIFNYFCYKYGYFNLYYTVVACGSLNPKDIAKNFTKDFYSSDAKSVMSYIDLSEKKKTSVNGKITQVFTENAAKAKRMGGAKDIQNDNNQSTNISLAKKDRKRLVLLK